MHSLFGFTSVQITAILLLIAGTTLRFIISKRQFDRRTITGLQQFRNYWTALIITIIERLTGLAAFLFIIAGLFLLLIEWYNDSNIK